jgi:RNA polymerase sigma-70 factor (family 1)
MQATVQIAQRAPEEVDELNLHAFRRGDEKAFRWVYDRLGKPLYYFAQNIVDSPAEAEDIVANAFVKLCGRSRETMESYEHIKRWLYVIVRNEAIDYLRYKNRSREVHQDLLHSRDKEEQKVDLEMLRMDLLQSLQEAIKKLPKQRKTILQLYFFEQKTTAEIAEQMQLNSQTVLNHKTRALESLRKTVLMPEWLLPALLVVNLPWALFLMK